MLLQMQSHTSMAAGQCRRDDIPEYLHKNKQLLNHVFETFEIVPNLAICHEACDYIATCQSANFLQSKKICELNNATHLSTPVKENFKNNSDSVYFLYRNISGKYIKLY